MPWRNKRQNDYKKTGVYVDVSYSKGHDNAVATHLASANRMSCLMMASTAPPPAAVLVACPGPDRPSASRTCRSRPLLLDNGGIMSCDGDCGVEHET